jgi:hypothetical protein
MFKTILAPSVNKYKYLTLNHCKTSLFIIPYVAYRQFSSVLYSGMSFGVVTVLMGNFFYGFLQPFLRSSGLTAWNVPFPSSQLSVYPYIIAQCYITSEVYAASVNGIIKPFYWYWAVVFVLIYIMILYQLGRLFNVGWQDDCEWWIGKNVDERSYDLR